MPLKHNKGVNITINGKHITVGVVFALLVECALDNMPAIVEFVQNNVGA